ncbi:MAG: VOC family protein [Nitriliruptorales bacterium]|nr:VOC family protein [Nitriliruptorales bacterium]
MTEPTGPALAAIHHVALTVTDLDTSVAWYERVLGFERAAEVPHYQARSAGHGVMLLHPDSDLPVVLHHHDANAKEPFSESRTGMDHVGLAVPTRGQLDEWRERFAEMGVTQSPIVDLEEYEVSVLVFRDPDDIQLELVAPIR